MVVQKPMVVENRTKVLCNVTFHRPVKHFWTRTKHKELCHGLSLSGCQLRPTTHDRNRDSPADNEPCQQSAI